MSRFTNRLSLIVVSIAGLGLFLSFHAPTASALSASDWNSGRIMSDDLFFKSDSMSVSDIQNFLNSMVPTCDTQGTQPYNGTTAGAYGASRGYPPPYTCLKNYYENPTTHQNNANGGSVTGGASAAEIIKSAADTYGVSPKVILVLLQKEQTLITDTWPWTVQYRSATGYGCPDTAPCDAEYYGFYNQVMKAAYQFKRYAQNPSEYRYKAFQNNSIQWNPVSSCGGSDVYISNQATAGLYNYTPYQPNAAALNNLYGMGDGCSAYGNRNFWRMYSDWFGSTLYEEKFLIYKSHISNTGWSSQTTNSGVTGTTGKSKALEALRIDGDVEYTTYSNTTSWQPTVSKGMISGTTGLSRPIQAIKINLITPLSSKYDIYYRTHTSSVGWMGWAKNGQIAGVTGSNTKNIEAIEIQLVLKGYGAPESSSTAYENLGVTSYAPAISLSMSTHIGDIGWQSTVTDTMVSGTTEQTRRIEAVKIGLNNNTGLPGGITYSAHVSGKGWQDFESDNNVAGTTGQSRRMEAIRIALTGSVGDSYDVWYRGYVKYRGWMGWTKNGYPAGSIGSSLQLEAIETRIVPKNTSSLSDANSLYNPTNQPLPASETLIYSTHLSDIGWRGGVTQNATGGTTGQSRAMEAIRFDTVSSIYGTLSVSCSVYIKSTSWMSDVTTGSVCGTTGQSKPLESIKLSLTGTAASKYDIFYKVHLSKLGWQDWAKNGDQVGNPASGKQIEAIILKLVKK